VNRISVSILVALISSAGSQTPPPLQATDWALGGTKPAAYVLEANGRATDPNGATLSLRSAADATGSFGSVASRLSADAFAADA
jgi:hypothetical protein